MPKYFLSIFIFISVFVLSALFTDILSEKYEEQNSNIAAPTSYTETQENPLYRISVWNGKIAVFKGNSESPYKVYDTYVNSLPKADAEKLTSGISVYSSDELLKLIEDYTS